MYSNLFFDFRNKLHHIWVRGTEASLELASVFSTFPNPALTTAQAFLGEVIITAILMGVIMSLTDDNNGLPQWADGAAADRSVDCGDRQFDGPADRVSR